MLRKALLVMMLTLAVAGCAAPAMKPWEARQRVLAQPEVAAWYAAHSAPTVLEGLSPSRARAFRRYQPAVTVDLVKEGLLVKLEAAFGPQPRSLELLVDGASGAVRPLRRR